MRKFLLVLAAGTCPILTPQAAAAQSSAAGPDAVVTGDNRVVCRRVTRTATRMRVGRICRTQSEWARDVGRRMPDPNDPNGTIDGAADTLDAFAADDISTNCTGDPLNRTPDTPLGPR
jgi:hypothetical protein